MNKEFFKSLLLISLVLLSIVMTKNLLDSKTPDMMAGDDVNIVVDKALPNIEHVIYPQDFVLSFGGGSYTGVYSEESRESIWTITKQLIPAYLNQVDLVVTEIDKEEFYAVERTRSVQMRLPFPISLNDVGDVYGVERGFNEKLNSPVNKLIISSSQQNRIYVANENEGEYFYLKGSSDDTRISRVINIINDESFTEYRRVDSLINFKTLKDDEAQSFYNNEIIPITALKNIPFVKVTKEIDTSDTSQSSEIKTFLSRAFGDSTDFIKRLEEIDGSQTYIYGYGDKSLRLGVDGKISYQEKLQSSTETRAVGFKEGLMIALSFADKYGNMPNSLYLSDYKVEEHPEYEVKTYYFDYRIRDINTYIKSMTEGHAVEVVLKNDVVTKFTKNVRRYVKSIDTSEIWSSGPMFVEELINENFDVISKNFNEDFQVSFLDKEKNWRMTTYVLSIMQNLRNVELNYYLDPELDDERLIPAWHLEIGNTRYYFHVYTGDILLSEKIVVSKETEISKR